MKFTTNRTLEIHINKDVVRFLKKKGIYNLYYFNLEQHLNKRYKEYPNVKICYPLTIGSFKWDDSKEKYNFWLKLENEFSKKNNKGIIRLEYLKNIL